MIFGLHYSKYKYLYAPNNIISKEGINLVKFNYTSPFANIFFLKDGTILYGSNEEELNIGLYDEDFNVIWNKFVEFHHELELGNHSVFFLTKDIRDYNGKKVNFDSIVELSLSDGEEISRWSSFDNLELIKKYHYPLKLDDPEYNGEDAPRPWGELNFDYYHINSVKVIQTNKNNRDSRFREGNLIVSFSYANLILILDRDTKKIVWDWGIDNLDFMHAPVMLPNGNILIFDNGKHRNYSRVIELNPINKQIVWEYTADPKESFFSPWGGSVERLRNGNTLIAESNKNHILEVTPKGEVVFSEYLVGEGLYRVKTLPSHKVEVLLDKCLKGITPSFVVCPENYIFDTQPDILSPKNKLFLLNYSTLTKPIFS